jgi:hypothetical protein
MDDERAAVRIEEISDIEAICIELYIRHTVVIYEQNREVTGVIFMRMRGKGRNSTQIKVTESRGERLGGRRVDCAFTGCVYVEPMKAWREVMDAYLDGHITAILLSEPRCAHLVVDTVIKLHFRAKILRPCRSNQHEHRHD